MIKLKNSAHFLVESAIKKFNQLEVKDDIKIRSIKLNLFINIREINKFRRIFDTKQVPRVIVEFSIDPYNPHHKKKLNKNLNFIFYCASEWRLFLARLTINNIEVLNTFHLIGVYNKWPEVEEPIEETRLFHKNAL